MRHALVRLMGLLIALMLVLTGCNLIAVDPIMQLDEDMAALKKQYSGVVATYDGGQITQEDVMGNFNSQYSYMSQMYAMYGMNLDSQSIQNIKQQVVENAVQGVAISAQLESRGLKLDDEKLAEIESETDEHYNEVLTAIQPQATGDTEELKAKQTEYNIYKLGYTRDAIHNTELFNANYELIEQAVRDEVAEVTDEQLKAAYDEKVSSDEENYANSPAAFESAMTSGSTVVCWMPEGYRTVKHILVKPEDNVLQAVTDARNAVTSAETELENLRSELDAMNDKGDEDAEEATEEAAEAEPTAAPRTAEEIQADIDAAEANLKTLNDDAEKAEAACLESVKEKTDEIYKKIEDGEDFAALIEAYGEDPGMQNEPSKTRGYYVSSASTSWDKHFTADAMALEKVGDVSKTPVITTSGVHIIRYESDVTGGAVPLEDVHDALYEDTLDDMKTEHFDTELKSWVDALNPVYTIENFDLTSDD